MTFPKAMHTIVIPVFNGGYFLEEAILSAVSQTYSNLEIIVVDDGSTDSVTHEVLYKYRKEVRVLQKANGGTASALNLGFHSANGEYLHWLSHDDLYFPTKVESVAYEYSKFQNPSNVICLGSWLEIDTDGQVTGQRSLETTIPLELQKNPYWPILLGMANGCAISFSKKKFLDMGDFREDLPTTQDYDYWLKMFPKSEIHLIDEFLVANRIHPDQGSFKIKTHQSEADDFYLNLIHSISPDFEKNLGIPALMAVSRISRHLAPSSYEKSKRLIAEIWNSEFKTFLEEQFFYFDTAKESMMADFLNSTSLRFFGR